MDSTHSKATPPERSAKVDRDAPTGLARFAALAKRLSSAGTEDACNILRLNLFGDEPDGLREAVDPKFFEAIGYFAVASAEAEANLGMLLRELRDDMETPTPGSRWWASGKQLADDVLKAVDASDQDEDMKAEIKSAVAAYRTLFEIRNQILHGTFLFKPRNPNLRAGVFTNRFSNFPLLSWRRAKPAELQECGTDFVVRRYTIEDIFEMGEIMEEYANELVKIELKKPDENS